MERRSRVNHPFFYFRAFTLMRTGAARSDIITNEGAKAIYLCINVSRFYFHMSGRYLPKSNSSDVHNFVVEICFVEFFYRVIPKVPYCCMVFTFFKGCVFYHVVVIISELQGNFYLWVYCPFL